MIIIITHTPWRRVLLEKLTVAQLVKKFLRLLWNPNIRYSVRKVSLLDSTMSQLSLVHTPVLCLYKIHFNIILIYESQDSSVGIALDYGLDDQGSRVRFLEGAGNFSLRHRVQNGSGAHPASYSLGTRHSFPEDKAAGA
jgi:hypothetical protein